LRNWLCKMKEFSKEWKSSTKARKQVKYRENAPLHMRQKFTTAKLSDEQAKKHGVKRIPVRKGDKVKIVRGQFKGKTGKINRVNLVSTKIYIDGIDRTKTEGAKAFYAIHPSNVIIIELNVDDKRRLKRKAK
jgi:large subunit ribosomal protein L24